MDLRGYYTKERIKRIVGDDEEAFAKAYRNLDQIDEHLTAIKHELEKPTQSAFDRWSTWFMLALALLAMCGALYDLLFTKLQPWWVQGAVIVGLWSAVGAARAYERR